MEQGFNEASESKYYRVTAGHIRLKTDQSDSNAKKREIEQRNGDKKTVYERVFSSVTAKFVDLSMRSHDEYGNTWNMTIDAAGEQVILQFAEESRYCSELLKKVPNMKLGEIYTITPYDFEKNGKRNVGLSIKQGDEKVQSFYQDFKEVNGRWEITDKYGYPEFDGDKNDKDDLKIYFTKVKKFLRNATAAWLDKQVSPVESVPEPVEEPNDDLPF